MATGNTDQRNSLGCAMEDIKNIKKEFQYLRQTQNDRSVSEQVDRDNSNVKKTDLEDDHKPNYDKLGSLIESIELHLTEHKSLYDKTEDNGNGIDQNQQTKDKTNFTNDNDAGQYESSDKILPDVLKDYDLPSQIKKLEDRIVYLEKENSELRLQASCTTSKIGHTVYIHSYYHGDMLKVVQTELMKQVSLNFKKVEFKVFESTEDLIQGAPLIAICINVSRLKTDATNAIKGVIGLGNTVLVVFHHTEQCVLTFPPSSNVLNGQQFNSLAGIYDMAFLQQSGVYQCDMNTKSLAGIVTFLKNYLKPIKRHTPFT